MQVRVETRRGWAWCAASGFVAVAIFAGASSGASAQSWPTYGHDAQRSADASVASMLPGAIRWKTPVDLDPQYSGNILYTHYGSPLITSKNTVLVPVKTQAHGGFQLQARLGSSGALLWSINSDYTLPQFNWTPPWGPVLTPGDSEVVMPAAGGTLLVRVTPDSGHGNLTRIAFYGLANYQQNVSGYNSAIQICTPITSDGAGNFYFGYVSTGDALPGYPNGIPSGLAKVSTSGAGTFTSAAAMSKDATMVKVNYNCAPAVSVDRSTVYVSVNNVPLGSAGQFGSGYLCKLSTANLSWQSSVFLKDPRNNYANPATMTDDSSSSPTIGLDGDVYYGVLEYQLGSHHERGWMLHFNSALTVTKTPGSFGWDDSAAIVPATAVQSYTGTSKYLILTKYNNYANGGGNGQNELAILDPNNLTENDPINPGTTVMYEVLTVLGPTPNSGLEGVREWCINSAAIDSMNKCAVVNSEDGHIYRWDFTLKTLTATVDLNAPTGEAYTCTLIGPDGAVYAINNAELYCVQAVVMNTAGAASRSLPRARTRRSNRAVP